MSIELSPHDLALRTFVALKGRIESKSWTNAKELFDSLKSVAKNLLQEFRYETPVINIYLRVLKIIREECNNVSCKGSIPEGKEENLATVLFCQITSDPLAVERDLIYESIIDAMREMKSEITNSQRFVEMQALQHIHVNEVVMTLGHSKSVLGFLLYAAKNRKLTVLVAQCTPDNTGLVTAEELRKNENLNVELLPDSHIFACMPRVNKVIVGCHAIYSDGSFRTSLGVNTMVMAAQTYRVPVCACFANYKVSPLPPTKHERLSQGDVSLVYPGCPEWVEVIAPKWDFISYKCVSLLITDIKGYDDPINLFHLTKDSFHRDDVADLRERMKADCIL